MGLAKNVETGTGLYASVAESRDVGEIFQNVLGKGKCSRSAGVGVGLGTAGGRVRGGIGMQTDEVIGAPTVGLVHPGRQTGGVGGAQLGLAGGTGELHLEIGIRP